MRGHYEIQRPLCRPQKSFSSRITRAATLISSLKGTFCDASTKYPV